MSTSDREPAGPDGQAAPDGGEPTEQPVEESTATSAKTAEEAPPPATDGPVDDSADDSGPTEQDGELSAIPEDGTPAPADPSRAFGARSTGSRVFGQPPADRSGGGTGKSRQPRQDASGGAAPSGRSGPTDRNGPGNPTGPANANPYDPRARTDSAAPNAGTPAQGSSGKADDQRRKLMIRGWLALALGLGALLASILVPAGLALGVPAIILGALALRAGRRAGQSVPGALPGIVLGSLSSLVSVVLIVALAMFWKEASTFQECQVGANTHVAQERCMTQFQDQLERRLDQLGVR